MRRYNMIARFQGTYTGMRAETKYLVVHHAAALYRQLTGAEDVQAVADYHINVKKWPGIGYQSCIAEETNGGQVARYDVSDPRLIRANVWGMNDVSAGVSCLTNFTGMPEQKWIDGLAEVLTEWSKRWPGAAVVGHGEIALPGHGTACPGPLWHAWKPTLLRAIGHASNADAYQVNDPVSDDPDDNFAATRQGPAITFKESNIDGVPYRLAPGTVWAIDDIKAGWAHLQNGMGFVAASLLHPFTPASAAPGDDLSIMAPPRISRGQFITNLRVSNSPALAAGDDMYTTCVQRNIDPAVFGAIFHHESQFGRVGICTAYGTRSPGNVRAPWDDPTAKTIAVPGRQTFAQYASWQAGAADMCKRLHGRYIDRGLDTVRKAIPVWAPKSDGNDPEVYIAAILRDVRSWQAADQR